MIESLTLNPTEFAPNRVSLSLHELGLEVGHEGVDWGEAQVAVQLARKPIGSVVTDRHLDPVEMTIPIVAMEKSDVPLADALYRLQQVVGLMQADEYETNWIKREFSDGVGTAGAVGYQIHSAALHGLQGRALAFANVAPEITLKMLRSPLCYATEKVAGAVHKLEDGRALEFEEEEILGTAPGLMEILVTNEGEVDLRGLVVALESRDHPQDESKDTTAKLTYGCEDLTLSAGSEVKEREGASGGKVVRAALTKGWLAILSSKIDGVGHMTHVGPRRARMRVYDPGAVVGDIELGLQYRVLGAVNWTDTVQTVSVPLIDDFALIDLGEVRAERPVLGDPRLEWRLLGRAVSGSGTIDLDQVYMEPAEQHTVVRTPYVAPQADLQETNSPGTVANDAAVGTYKWQNTSNVKASDNTYAETEGMGIFGQSNYLKVTNFIFGLPEAASVLGITCAVKRRTEGPKGSQVDYQVRIVKGGALGAANRATPNSWSTSDEVVVYGDAADLWGEVWTVADINASDFGVALAVKGTGSGTSQGKIDHVSMTVYYTEGEQEGKVSWQGRSVAFTPTSVLREDQEDNVWGELVNEGFNLYAPPSYLEGRAMRGLVIPSQGDLGSLADSGFHNLSVQAFHFPAYHFVREAAS